MVIRNVTVNDCTPETIVIGRRGTYETMQVVFDLTYLIENYGDGTAVLALKRSQDSSAYPAVESQDGNALTWTVSETDTYYVGAGECQLMWYVDGGLAKTIIYPMVVMKDILSTAEEPPDGYENWVEHLTELGAETQQHALDAAQSASDAESAKDDAVTAKEAAEEAAETAQEAVVHAPIIQNGYWYIWNDGQYVDTGVRAEGQKGDKGDTGEKGDTGNGIASITKTGTSGLVDTYTVTYTDGTTTTFTVTNGAKGDKGDTGATGNGIQSITKTGTSGNVDTYTITYTNGQTTTFTVTNGAVSSVAGKTGAVTLDANDVAFSESGTYDDGTVGKELSDQKNAIDTKAPVIINTASGDIATFSDGADGMPIKHLVANIEAVQSGSGDPSPSNIRPITGWTGLTCVRNGINQWDEQWENGYYYKNSSDKIAKGSSQTTIRSKNPIPIKQNTSYSVVGAVYKYFFTDADDNVLADGSGGNIITPDGACYLYFYCENVSTYSNNISINYPSTDTDYHSGKDNQVISVSWSDVAGTVYGATLDVVTGEFTVLGSESDMGSLNWTKNDSSLIGVPCFYATVPGIKQGAPLTACASYKVVRDRYAINGNCMIAIGNITDANYIVVRDDAFANADAASFKAAMSGVQLVYLLATPIVYHLDPVTMETLLGNNTVYVDCGSVTVDYPADTGIVVDDLSNAINQKQDAPQTAGTAGQVLGLDSNLDPVWVNQSGGGDTSNCAPIIINTASGDVASFVDGADNRQIRKIVGTIVPQQSGTGDPSPDNVRPISGRTGCEIGCAGANMFNPLSAIFKVFEGSSTWNSESGKISLAVNAQQVGLLYAVKPNTTYRIGANKPSSGGSTLWSAYEYTDIPINVDDYLVSAPTPVGISNAQYLTITTTSETNYICFYFKKSSGTGAATVSDIWVSIDRSCTSYAPYVPVQTLSINWQSSAGTIYGVTVTLNEDGSVDMVVNRGMADLGDFTYTKNAISGTDHYYFTSNNNSLPNAFGNGNYSGCGAICEQYKDSIGLLNNIDNSFSIYEVAHRVNIQDYSKDNYTVAEFKAAMTGIKLVYLLVTPQTYHFDNIGELYTYLGTNNVWIDTGSITECDYPADTKLYVDGLTAPDEDMIANANIASGKYFVVNNQLYLSTAAIAAGASIVPGTNCTATNLAEALNALNT